MTSEQVPVRVIIAEDHHLFADGLEQILTVETGFEILAKVGNGKLLMQTLNRMTPDLVLLDINMPLMDGLETALQVKKKQPRIKVVFISMYYDPAVRTFMQREDVDGFIIKQTSAPQFKEALKNIMQGNKIFLLPPELSAPEKESPSLDSDFLKMYKLTGTEITIIRLIAAGDSSKEIAAKRGLSPLTVEVHRKNIFRKLQAKNMADVVAFAAKNGLIG